MSEDEIDIDALIAKSEQIETHERRSETDDDDYVVMALYKTAEGKHFCYIEMSGMNSPWAGAMGVVEWLDDASVASWTKHN